MLRKSRKRIIVIIVIAIGAITGVIGVRGLVFITDLDTGTTVTDIGTDIGGSTSLVAARPVTR